LFSSFELWFAHLKPDDFRKIPTLYDLQYPDRLVHHFLLLVNQSLSIDLAARSMSFCFTKIKFRAPHSRIR
jgi:hypothetical protein